MPIDVAVEEPDARVVGLEAQDGVATCLDHESVAAKWNTRKLGAVAIVCAYICGGAGKDLIVVAVEVEGVTAGIQIVEDNVDDGIVGEDVGVGIHTVYH